jgi:futalosine hydrolase
MKKLVVAATLDELTPLLEHFKLSGDRFIETAAFDVLITGVGMTATAFALGQHLPGSYSLVLNLGIAGSFNRNTPLGSVVQVISDVFAELGAENKEQFLSIEQLGFGTSTYLSTGDLEHQALEQLLKVKAITVNKVHGNKLSIAAVVNRLDPEIESMEGAAVFYCCSQTGLPALQVRSISNYVEERNKGDWKIGLAIKNLNQWAIDFLTNT